MPKSILDLHSGLTVARGTWYALASSTARVGRYSDLIDLSAVRYPLIEVHFKVKCTGTPTGNRGAHLFWIHHDAHATNPLVDDGATWDANNMAAQSSLTQFAALYLGSLPVNSSPTSNQVLGPGTFKFAHPGPKGCFFVYQDTGVALSSDDQEVVNGDFASDTVWTKGSGWTIAGGVGVHTPSGGGLLAQASILTVGKTYRVSYEIKNWSAGSIRVRLGTTGADGTIRNANGTYVQDIVATGTDLQFEPIEVSADLDIDNVSCVLLDANAVATDPVNLIRWRGVNPELQ